MAAKRKPVIRPVKNAKGVVTHLTQIGNSSPRRRRITNAQRLDKAQLAADLYRAATASQQAGTTGNPTTAGPWANPDLPLGGPGGQRSMSGENSVADALFPDVPEANPYEMQMAGARGAYGRLGSPGAPAPRGGVPARQAGKGAKRGAFPKAVRT